MGRMQRPRKFGNALMVPEKLEFSEISSKCHICITVSDELWPRYFSESFSLNLCRHDMWKMMAHAGTKLGVCRPKNLKKVKFCHFQISTSPRNVGRFPLSKNQNVQIHEAYKVQYWFWDDGLIGAKTAQKRPKMAFLGPCRPNRK